MSKNSTQIESITATATKDRQDVVQVIKEVNDRIDQLAEKVDGDGLGEVVREAVDDHLAQFGMGLSLIHI